jgi:antitoxin component YwqK of YwqJK toxin-antitoxin module
MPKYKKISNNENAIEIDGKVVLSFDPRYKEYLKWRDENPDLEKKLVDNNVDVFDKLFNHRLEMKRPEYVFYWKNGNIMVKGGFVGNFKIYGQWLWYYENGNIQSEINYVDGFKEGLFKLYYKNGNIKVQGKYKKDNRNGVWLINDKKRKYQNGKEL